LRLAYSALELSPWAMRLTLWGTLDARAEPTWPAQAFRRSQLCTLCWPALLRRPLAVRSRLGPNVDASLAGFKEVSYYHRVTPAGLSTVHEGHPFVRGLPPRRSPTWGSVHSGDEGPLVSGERPVLTQVRSMGLWIRFSTRSAGVSMDAK